MFKSYLTLARNWFYPPQKTDVTTTIDRSKQYKPNESNHHAIMEKVSKYREHYSTYQLNDAILGASVVGANAVFSGLLYLLGLNGALWTLAADIPFMIYGVPGIRQEYQKDHEQMLDELMTIYKWMATGYGPAVTHIEKDANGVEKQNLYIEMLAVLAAFNSADKLDVWNGRQGEFSPEYWKIMRQPPHYKTQSLHSPDAVEATASSVVALTKVLGRNWLYAPSKPKEVYQQEQNQTLATQVQETSSVVVEMVAGKGIEFWNMAKTAYASVTSAATPAPAMLIKKNG